MEDGAPSPRVVFVTRPPPTEVGSVTVRSWKGIPFPILALCFRPCCPVGVLVGCGGRVCGVVVVNDACFFVFSSPLFELEAPAKLSRSLRSWGTSEPTPTSPFLLHHPPISPSLFIATALPSHLCFSRCVEWVGAYSGGAHQSVAPVHLHYCRSHPLPPRALPWPWWVDAWSEFVCGSRVLSPVPLPLLAHRPCTCPPLSASASR